jgi:hypothetical protein
MTRSSQRREMAGKAVALHGISVALGLPHLWCQRDLLSLQRQAERRERADRRSADRADEGEEDLGLRPVFSLPAQCPGTSLEPQARIPHSEWILQRDRWQSASILCALLSHPSMTEVASCWVIDKKIAVLSCHHKIRHVELTVIYHNEWQARPRQDVRFQVQQATILVGFCGSEHGCAHAANCAAWMTTTSIGRRAHRQPVLGFINGEGHGTLRINATGIGRRRGRVGDAICVIFGVISRS